MLKLIKKRYPYFPILGIGAYLLFFVIATTQYPGGSIHNIAADSYSYFHNFLCDLMHNFTEDGAVNHARPIAVIAHWMLSFAMISFFYVLPEIFSYKNRNTLLMQVFGIITMTIFIFMYTDYHDQVVTLVGIFGTIALIPFFMEVLKHEVKGFRILSYCCIALSLIVYFSWETRIGFYYLPALQKVTFLVDTWWVVWVSLMVAQKHRILRRKAIS